MSAGIVGHPFRAPARKQLHDSFLAVQRNGVTIIVSRIISRGYPLRRASRIHLPECHVGHRTDIGARSAQNDGSSTTLQQRNTCCAV
jgi:hypothetical protein